MPDWERLAAHIEADPESKEQLGWVREMYAFSVAVALQGIHLDLARPPLNRLITQPPADANLGLAAMFHYTWGSVFQNSSGGKVWEFDKRAFTDASIVTTVSIKGLGRCDAEVIVYWELCMLQADMARPGSLLLCCYIVLHHDITVGYVLYQRHASLHYTTCEHAC